MQFDDEEYKSILLNLILPIFLLFLLPLRLRGKVRWNEVGFQFRYTHLTRGILFLMLCE